MPPLGPLYFIHEGRVKICRQPQEDCLHIHHYFLAVAARDIARFFLKEYHINSHGEIERCGLPSCQKPRHFMSRQEIVTHHKETYDFSGQWRARENPYVSFLEKELGDFVSLLPYPVTRNTSTVIGPWELDLYFPTRNIAVEFNGDYWHSDSRIQNRYGMTAKEYHLGKVNACAQQDITLGFVWETNWLHKLGDYG
jgi:hypothetical protein